ncbi:gamma-glutamylcyclotransferase [Frigidibacter sp. ROC022]|uniref:gamma-glutamylcyclotransferase n=1 Tax=Frigidibacter sp. ROC022 TaxID=2971796 RepID=UPI00215B663B|nr:gamma-glutamylcyclotransferase [Frigidibacter sp. ROC022]MCR8722920.1 gamma-glutamylcyclotransferase [Frigidibacter sp. ROC022]
MALWVFGYGSLVWNPGFTPVERQVAELPGFARSFCMRSIHHRGTPEAPGLVLALDADPGATCKGVALRVAEAEEDAVTAYLRERELISSAYLEEHHPVRLIGSGATVAARCFVVDRNHAQYCGGLALEEQAGIIARAAGGRGPNDAYLHQTVAHLSELGIGDADLEWLSARVRHLTGG